MIIVFAPLMVILVTILLPINYNGGKNSRRFDIGGNERHFNVTGLDTLSWVGNLFAGLGRVGWSCKLTPS